MKIVLKNLEDTKLYATQLVKGLKGGEFFILTGELGTGKTTLVKLVARALGVKKNVVSPTFTLMQSYATKHPKIKILHHLDLYRLKQEEELAELGLEEIINQPQTIIFVEWGERFFDFFKKFKPRQLVLTMGAKKQERVIEIF